MPEVKEICEAIGYDVECDHQTYFWFLKIILL